ncbi:hypothetical protein K8O92_23605 [Nocardia asteroides]|nr:hypothetical protein K8O92_23605 [Nocardia asteroides]
MTLIDVARACAIPVSLWLLATLILDPGYRANNIFAAPDFGFSLVLLIAAFLPRRTALPSLMAGYFFGSGVITIAALDRFYRSESVRGIVDSIIAATYLSVALLLFHRIGRTGTDAPRTVEDRHSRPLSPSSNEKRRFRFGVFDPG